MGRSLVSAARGLGYAEADVEALREAFTVAMTPRVRSLEDDHHPAYLHPGRSALILLRDVGMVDGSVLVAAAVHESLDASLRVPPEVLEAVSGAAVVEELAEAPLPGDRRLAERLLCLGPGLPLAVLAEWLDQLRHLHLRPDLSDRWPAVHEEVVRVWLPFAHRVDARLATRYGHWARTFSRRF